MILVQCDFDDTITVGNVSTAIRDAFGPDGLDRIEEDYLAGRCSVEESNIRQFALVRADVREVEEFVLTQVVVRDGFQELVEYCQGVDTRLVVVSSGLDLYINPTMKRLGLEHMEVHSARARVNASGIEVEYSDPSGSMITRGFKESYVRQFRGEGYSVIYIGDGMSDIVPATEADFVIARSTLARHCGASGIPHRRFEDFEDVRRHVEEILQPVGQ